MFTWDVFYKPARVFRGTHAIEWKPMDLELLKKIHSNFLTTVARFAEQVAVTYM